MVFLVLFMIYSANGRNIGTGDAAPTTFLAAALAQGDALVLDRYRRVIGSPPNLPYWAAQRDGRIVSLYPVAPAVMAAPFFWLQMTSLDAVWPGWKRHEVPVLFLMGKNVAAVLAALTGAGLLLVLSRLGLRHDLLPVLVAACLGSEMWVVGSQSLWQHGPAALVLTVALGLALSDGHSAIRLLTSGIAAGLVFACRLPTANFVLPLGAWMILRHRSKAGWFLAGLLPVIGLVIFYNVAWFGNWAGGITVLEARFAETHAVSGRWNVEHVLEGVVGTLVSPSRGLFLYCPWTVLVIATLPFYWDRLMRQPLVAFLGAALVPSAVLLSAYSTWWGGFSFGPRFWTDATPILAILLATCFAWARDRARPVRVALYLAILVAVLVQAVGAFYYPSSWNGYPMSVDQDHKRLWNWTDNEITRCLREGIHRAVGRPLSQDAMESAYGLVRSPVPGG